MVSESNNKLAKRTCEAYAAWSSPDDSTELGCICGGKEVLCDAAAG